MVNALGREQILQKFSKVINKLETVFDEIEDAEGIRRFATSLGNLLIQYNSIHSAQRLDQIEARIKELEVLPNWKALA